MPSALFFCHPDDGRANGLAEGDGVQNILPFARENLAKVLRKPITAPNSPFSPKANTSTKSSPSSPLRSVQRTAARRRLILPFSPPPTLIAMAALRVMTSARRHELI
jgi:hypothetical protein